VIAIGLALMFLALLFSFTVVKGLSVAGLAFFVIGLIIFVAREAARAGRWLRGR
jgi:uncharacterized membrane-anchored protein